MTTVTLPLAVAAGLASFASPCFLPVVPAVVAQVVGDGRARGRGAVTRAAAFVVGFSIVFVAVWASLGLVGQVLGDHRDLARVLGGVLLVVMGLHLAGLVEIPLLHRQWRLSAGPVGSTRPVGSAGLAGSTGPAGPASDRTGTLVPRPDQRTPGHRRALLMGLAFGAGWTPCIGPILGAVIGVASGETMADGALLLIAYCLGLGLPLLAVAGGAGVVGSRWSVLRRRAALVEVTSGAIVALTGVALVANLFVRLAATLPALGG